jgi:hypothetical protein
MIDHIVAVIIGVLASIIASVVFFLFLCRLKPKIVISDQIAKAKDLNGETVYKIKTINKTRSELLKIEARLHLITPTTATGIITRCITEIPRIISDALIMNKFNLKDKEARYVYIFNTNEDIERFLQDDISYLRFRICAVHSFSGFGALYSKEHYTREDIIEGTFDHGNSLEIK